jgi:Fur family ferric uptake transcriptional regulator
MTRQRRIILEELRNVSSHPTADGLHRMVRRRLPRISLGTVYRNLEMLSRQGVILKLDLGGDQRRFDGRTDPHYHVRCLRCDAICDLVLAPLESLEHEASGASEWELLGHRIELVGFCPDCKEKERKGPAREAASGAAGDAAEDPGNGLTEVRGLDGARPGLGKGGKQDVG